MIATESKAVNVPIIEILYPKGKKKWASVMT
jgi:hypothetical protein